jgi:hypothetical protein
MFVCATPPCVASTPGVARTRSAVVTAARRSTSALVTTEIDAGASSAFSGVPRDAVVTTTSSCCASAVRATSAVAAAPSATRTVSTRWSW